ncbi:MAG TPA: recombinase family protein [Pseudobdellovibrionaceae bacterium]|jgi:DNA invertase Pin-like site-specific DNA recombinase
MKLQPKIAIYIRTAIHGKDSRQTLKAQEAACRKFIDSQLPELASVKGTISVYQDLGHSAMDMKRPGLKKLLVDLKNMQMRTIITTDMIRLFRRPQDAATLQRTLSELNVTALAVDGSILGSNPPVTERMAVL